MPIKKLIGKPICGFANRIKFMASLHILAKKLKIKNIDIIWTTALNCNINPNEIFDKIPNIQFINESDIFEKKEEVLYFGHIHMNTIESKLEDICTDKEILLIEGGHESQPNGMNVIEFMKAKSKFYNSIIWNSSIIEKVNQYNNIPSIAIHYRHAIKSMDEADIQANPLVNFSANSPFSEFERIIKRCKHKMFFISNSLYHKNYINKNYSKKVTIINLEDDNQRSEKISMINSVVEFLLLSKSSMIIGSYYSSFSDEPMYFNFIPKVMPILPDILANKELCSAYLQRYHSIIKPVVFDNYIVSNLNIKCLTEAL